MKIFLPLIAILGLSACMEGGAGVTRAASNFDAASSCSQGALPSRCGPQKELPYTLR